MISSPYCGFTTRPIDNTRLEKFMRVLRLTIPAAVLMAGLFVASNPSFAKPEYQKKEKGTKCTTCHVTAGKKDLNDVGKCYAEHKHVLEGCQAKANAKK